MTPAPYYPASFQVFTDGGSLCHLVWGWVAGQLPPHEAIALSAGFTAYQISQNSSGEPWPRIGGEMLEFAIGLLIARFTARW